MLVIRAAAAVPLAGPSGNEQEKERREDPDPLSRPIEPRKRGQAARRQ
jgi:hypothetical protein